MVYEYRRTASVGFQVECGMFNLLNDDKWRLRKFNFGCYFDFMILSELHKSRYGLGIVGRNI